ncbi:MAG: type II/IV secretion system protein, partial [Verrucomicrobiota bacterium]|nr:type II/IV secretion system protein [Verrucomicrobiota bacterium]
MPKLKNSRFLESIRQLPRFDYEQELDALADRHDDGLALLQAVIEEKLLPKDEACRLWADSLGFAYVDPFASVVTDEAIAKIPAEIAKKTKVLPLYVLGEGLTVALATPNDADLVKR